MYKRDYLLRLVEQLTAVVFHLTRLEQVKAYDEALETTDGVLRTLTGLGTDAWLDMETDDILANLSMRDDLGGVETAVFMIGIFHQEGKIRDLQGDGDGADFRYLKALLLQLALLNNYPAIPMPEMVPTVSVLRAYLTQSEVVLPPEANRALLTYYEKSSDYWAAEDVLYEWLDSEPGSSEPLEAGTAFYEKLLLKSDEELEAGGLPREEVEEGLEDLLNEAP